MDSERFIYQVSSKEIPVSIGGKNFEVTGYDCIHKKFFNVLCIDTDGAIVKVHFGDCKENLLIYD